MLNGGELMSDEINIILSMIDNYFRSIWKDNGQNVICYNTLKVHMEDGYKNTSLTGLAYVDVITVQDSKDECSVVVLEFIIDTKADEINLNIIDII